VVTGLSNLKDETCAGGCDGGGDSTQREDASNDASAPDEAADAAAAMEGHAADSGGEGSEVADAFGDATDATSEGDASGSDGSETKDAESKDAMGPTDAARETGGKCQSNPLAPAAAVASSTELALSANDAVDGILTTRWASAPGVDPQWIAIDYGAAVHIDHVQILWETACAVDYTLQMSSDMMNWTSFKTVNGNTQGGPPSPDWTTALDYAGLTAFGRYLRVYGTKRCTMFGYSIWEMRAFGDTDATCHP